MTISKYIVDFLKIIGDVEIDTNHMQDGSDQYGLFKSPARDTKNLIDGSYEIREYYQFLARLNSNSETERKEADEILENITYKLDDYSVKYDYPDIDGKRKVTDISITGCPYPMEAAERDTLYQISLSITYEREREVY